MLHLLCICYFTSFYLHIVLIISHLWRSGMRYLLEIIKPLECSWKISEIWASSMSLVFNMLMWSDHFFCVSAVSITLKHLNVLQPVAFTVYYPHCILSHVQLWQIHYSTLLSLVPSSVSEQGLQTHTRRRTKHTIVKACKYKFNLCNEYIWKLK